MDELKTIRKLVLLGASDKTHLLKTECGRFEHDLQAEFVKNCKLTTPAGEKKIIRNRLIKLVDSIKLESSCIKKMPEI